MVFIVEAGELELIKIRYNFHIEHCYHKNGNILTFALLDILPVLFVINLFKIFNNDI